MKTKNLAWLLAVALPLTFVACKPTEQAESDDSSDTAPQATPGEVAGVNGASDLSPVEAQTMIDDVTIGHKVTDGIIAPADQGDDFAPGDPIHLTMKVGDAPAGSEVKVIWYGPGEAKIGEDAKAVVSGATTLAFQAPDTSSWQKGDYRAEIWIGDEKVNQQTFNVTDKSGAGK